MVDIQGAQVAEAAKGEAEAAGISAPAEVVMELAGAGMGFHIRSTWSCIVVGLWCVRSKSAM